ncbi:MAG: four helix bundle protein [Pirellulales bacterium]|nr:four helix bundle protein [Pirellulales bacterium]
MGGRNFRDLKVWQLGMRLAEEVYRLSQQFPKHETYGLGSQIQRAAVSILANIAEGHAIGSTKDFARFLGIAQGSLAELETHLMLAERMKYGNPMEIRSILNRCGEEARMLRGLRKSIRSRLK